MTVRTKDITFPEGWAQRRTALSHDWLTGMRGGERVLELLCQGMPEAEIFTLIYNPKRVSEEINRHKVHTSWLQSVPGIMGHYRYFLAFFPGAIERMEVPAGEFLLSTSHCVAKGLKPVAGMKHVCYCFTPMRYAWTFYEEYFGANPLKKCVLSPVLARLRDWDRRASERVDGFVTLSRHVQRRIRDYYGRESDVVYPPVDTAFYTRGEARAGDFDLVVSALVPYKRVDLAVEAYTRTGRPLKVVGTGTEYKKLRHAAGANIEFEGWLSDEQIRGLYQQARCLIFPGEEDFGIVPVEAQACGCPVVAYGMGGARETVVDGETGVFFEEQTAESLLNGIEQFAARSWDEAVIRRHAEQFSPQVFIDGLEASIRKTVNGPEE